MSYGSAVGSAKAYGAITIVSGIATGKASALGIGLYTKATAEVIDEPKIILKTQYDTLLSPILWPMDDSLAKEVVRLLFESMGIKDKGCVISTESNIPVAVGLKSSSSAGVAIALAVLDALDVDMDAGDLLRIVAEASQLSGTSITGSLDDAAACMFGGIVITDNLERKVIVHRSVEEDLKVIILVPPSKQYTKTFKGGLLSPIKGLINEAYEMALKGDYWGAMTLNGILHASALNLPSEPIIEALRAGALAAGVSGTGPAITAVARGEEEMNAIKDVFRNYEGYVISCSVNNNRASKGNRS